MHSELLNLWLFAGVLGKAATMTGIAPGLLIFYAARMLVRTHRVPTHGLFRKVVSDVEHFSASVSYTLHAGPQIQHAIPHRNAVPLLDGIARRIGKGLEDANASASVERTHSSRVA